MNDSADGDKLTGSLHRAFALLRAVIDADKGVRLNALAEQTGMTQPTAHRVMQALIAEDMIEQDDERRYRPTLSLFALAARAGRRGNLRELSRPVLLRLSAMLNDTVFLLARNGYDAVCLDRCEGAFPIRSFTGDIGGKVVMGTGQGSLTILAFLPEAEREEVIRFNLPRLLDLKLHDEVSLRMEIARTRTQGYTVSSGAGSFPGMGGVAVPILDRQGYALASLSIGTLVERLSPERLPTLVDILHREARSLAEKLDPFDPTARRPAQTLGGQPIERARKPGRYI